MNKFSVIFIGICLALAACSNEGSQNNAAKTASSQPVAGGWAPVFFTDMNKVELDNISDGVNQHYIKRVVISYPTKMQPLAQQIHDYLESQTHIEIPLKTIELKDTDQVKYNLTQVIVTLYFN